ncbi:MAG: asparagine synthase (glutamine-hydrolyzing) [Arcobacteraceae bacterium]|jgi:asparagine synthase (glutamine-hydrolysing)|nr:asparagine synthase (glutamine-hydrolyzing) [Arcobacteraceae bacterium]
MCGIIGANFKPEIDFLELTELLSKRGPDNISTKQIGENFFGHTRLSIIDLENEANQPLLFDDILIVFNGEIYNYHELIINENLTCVTKSDTEVLVRLYQKYDTEFLKLLNGAFSFCIYDINKNRYFCARDRYGKKPFYYYEKDGKFIFSSLIKPIIASIGFTPRMNRIALSQYLQYFTPLTPNTFYEGILKLPKASYLLFENGKSTIKKYYRLKTYKRIHDEPTALSSIEDTLLKSVELRLNSDVEIGSLLSGGIDSSLISTMYANITGKTIKTFSIGYEGYEKYCELPYALKVAQNIKSDHTPVIFTKKDFLAHFDEVINALEEPHADHASSPLFYLSKVIQQSGIKTVFSGEGSDELFLGYNNYQKFYDYYEFKKTLSQSQKKFLKLNLGTASSNTKEIEYLQRIFNDETLYNSFGEIFTKPQKAKLFKKQPLFSEPVEKLDPIDWMSSIDMEIWLGESLLSKVDKITMANGVEARNPFLDFRLVDTALSIDSKLKLGDTNKYLLKKIAYKYLPKEIVERRKKGFNSPYNEWLVAQFGDEILHTIVKANQHHGLFNENYIKELFENAKNNKLKQHTYALYVFSLWYGKTYL